MAATFSTTTSGEDIARACSSDADPDPDSAPLPAQIAFSSSQLFFPPSPSQTEPLGTSTTDPGPVSQERRV